MYSKLKAADISEFQENKFDLNFVIDTDQSGAKIKSAIEKTDTKIIRQVELIDIYESEEKLPGQRSLTFKIYIQSMNETLNDTVKNNLIKNIIINVKKVG
jgi:phenylalanyl-tRNA synthetase beta subunit